MRKAWEVIKSIVTFLVVILAFSMMIFTIISVNINDQNNRNLFGYKAFIVLSDSMSATDFSAGDLIVLKQVNPIELKEGDIIGYVSRNDSSYGENVAHKIRRLTTDSGGNPGFITYGTTTDKDDSSVVTYEDVLGKYEICLPAVGRLFQFLKTIPGYIILILIPFLILIVLQGTSCVKQFQYYRNQQMLEIQEQRRQLKEEMEESRQMLLELQELKAELGIEDK